MDICQNEWNCTNGESELAMPTTFGGIHLSCILNFVCKRTQKIGPHYFTSIIMIFKNCYDNIYDWSILID